jgi:type I restriction enzyme S subunit
VESQGIIIGRKGSAGLVHFSGIEFFPIDTTFYISKNETDQDLMFLYYLLINIDLPKLKGDVGVPGINREMAYNELIAYPSDISEQKNIVEVLESIENEIILKSKKLEIYQNLFKTLLHELMSKKN